MVKYFKMFSKQILKERTKYNPLDFEDKIYKFWLPYFKVKGSKKRNNFIILIAPPNITGSLHLGHALENCILDVLARYKKMKGFNVIWVPGIDHAGIATQNVIEKELSKKGLTRFDLGKTKFIQFVWQWKDKYTKIISDQLKKLGLLLDWSRLKFTMDKKYTLWVEKAFIEYYKNGLIYRDFRPVNFCPHCKTSLSDLEIDYRESEGANYYIKYPLTKGGFALVSTTRPETMLGDTALAINPKDEKNFAFVGKVAILPIVERELPIIVDQRVDPKFGTGILKVTPAHSLVDYEIGLRHQLPMISVINEDAKINENFKEFAGLGYLEARQKIVEKLKSLNLLENIEKIKHKLPICYRCKTEIQIIPSKEWFLKMDYLAKLAYYPVKKRVIEIYPPRFRKIYFNWLINVRDWCISRKTWWGQQMPVWYCENCGDNVYVVSSLKPKNKCQNCRHTKWQRSEEVFDTWFSSALWPFATLYTDLEKKWYPADLVASARDILHLWITRMIFSGEFFMKKEPFKTVFIHPTVLTKEGKRMSKSLGVGIDPMDLIGKYGSDALRFGLLWQMSAHQDLKFDEVPVIQAKKFLNKIWNAYRFYFLFASELRRHYKKNYLSSADKKIISSFQKTKKFVESHITKFEIGLALKKIYKFFWDELCDFYLESCKTNKNNPRVLDKIMLETLKLLHPFLPHLTQLIYLLLGKKKPIFFEEW